MMSRISLDETSPRPPCFTGRRHHDKCFSDSFPSQVLQLSRQIAYIALLSRPGVCTRRWNLCRTLMLLDNSKSDILFSPIVSSLLKHVECFLSLSCNCRLTAEESPMYAPSVLVVLDAVMTPSDFSLSGTGNHV